MSTVPPGRRAERTAVNALRSLLEAHQHIVQEIDGSNDLGEDLYLDFTSDGHRTGDTVRVQVKGGISYRAAGGFRVTIGKHESDWADGNLPVLCVVHDPELNEMFWANATQQIRSARRERTAIKSVRVNRTDVLNSDSISDFGAEVRHYVSMYRGNRVIEMQLADMAGVHLGELDRIEHFVNVFGEDLIFLQRHDEPFATLYHSDLDWQPVRIEPESLDFDGLRGIMRPVEPPDDPFLMIGTPTVNGIILNLPEAYWLAACFGSTEWIRSQRMHFRSDPTRPLVIGEQFRAKE